MATSKTLAPRIKSYEDVALSREDCESILDCNPHHIRFIPPRLVDRGLVAFALHRGATRDEIPAY